MTEVDDGLLVTTTYPRADGGLGAYLHAWSDALGHGHRLEQIDECHDGLTRYGACMYCRAALWVVHGATLRVERALDAPCAATPYRPALDPGHAQSTQSTQSTEE